MFDQAKLDGSIELEVFHSIYAGSQSRPIQRTDKQLRVSVSPAHHFLTSACSTSAASLMSSPAMSS